MNENLGLGRCALADKFITVNFVYMLHRHEKFMWLICFNTIDVAICSLYIVHNSRANGALLDLTILLHLRDSVIHVPQTEGRKLIRVVE